MRDKKTITLGSGKLYIADFTGDIPADETIETPEKTAGLIKGGATLEYTPEFYTAKDDLGQVQKVIVTDEEVTLKSGIMTWNAETLKQLSATGRVTESGGKRTLKVGGLSHADGKKYVIRFVHKDPIDGDLRVTIVGQNQTGFVLAFAKDAETVIDAEFKAQPNDEEGTLVIVDETIPVTEG